MCPSGNSGRSIGTRALRSVGVTFDPRRPPDEQLQWR